MLLYKLQQRVIGLASHAKRDYGASAMTVDTELLPIGYTSYRWQYFFIMNVITLHFDMEKYEQLFTVDVFNCIHESITAGFLLVHTLIKYSTSRKSSTALYYLSVSIYIFPTFLHYWKLQKALLTKVTLWVLFYVPWPNYK